MPLNVCYKGQESTHGAKLSMSLLDLADTTNFTEV